MNTLIIGEVVLIVILFLLFVAIFLIKIQSQKVRMHTRRLREEFEAYKSGYVSGINTGQTRMAGQIVTPSSYTGTSSEGNRASRITPVTELRPGDKLAKEALYENGTILLNKGTILTKHYIDKLRENFIAEVEVEI